MKKTLALLAISVILLASCAYNSARSKSQLVLGLFSGSVWNVPNLKGYTLYDEAIADYTAIHPEIEIVYRPGTLQEDYSEWLSQKVLLGDAPDIFLLLNSDFDTFATAGVMEKLDNYIANDPTFDIDKFYKNASQLGIHNGSYYALPMELNPMVMGVNLDLLESESIALPDRDLTWEDFYDICSRVTKDTTGDGIIDQFGCVGFDWQQAMNTNSVKLFDVANNRALFNTEEARKALEFVRRLNQLNEGIRISASDFENGNAAFIVFPFSEYLSYSRYPYKITKNITFNWKCIKLPKGANGNSVGTFQSLLVAVNSKSRNKERAWEFLKYLVYSEEVQSKIYENSFGVPVIKEIAESEKSEEEFEKLISESNFTVNLAVLSDIIETSYLPARFSNYERAMDLADKELYSALDSGTDLTRALQILNIKINEILGSN